MLKNIIDILKKDGIGILPTDTIYGLVGSALSKKAVERIYKVKKRRKDKPCIILISSINDLEIFGIKLTKQLVIILKKLWPGKISIILPLKNYKSGRSARSVMFSKDFFYLHRGKNSLAFRLPKDRFLRKVLTKTGPLIAPSANLEGSAPAKNIEQAKRYFNDKVDFYFDKGIINKRPSIILEIKRV